MDKGFLQSTNKMKDYNMSNVAILIIMDKGFLRKIVVVSRLANCFSRNPYYNG